MLNERPEGKAYPTWPMGMPRSSFCRLIVFCFAKRTGVFGALFCFHYPNYVLY